MPKLYQIILEKLGLSKRTEPVRAEKQIYNPLNVKINQVFSIDNIDHRGIDYHCVAIKEYVVDMMEHTNKFSDFVLETKIDGGEEKKVRIRFSPDRKMRYGLPYRAVLFMLEAEIPYDKDFEQVLRDPSGTFKIDYDEAGIHEQFWRINDVKTSYIADVKMMEDKNENEQIEPTEIRRQKIEFWDYHREAEFDGVKETEFLLAEMNKNSGFCHLWRGKEIDPGRIFIL